MLIRKKIFKPRINFKKSKYFFWKKKNEILLKSHNLNFFKIESIESVRRKYVRKIKKQGLIVINLKPSTPKTYKSNESRMGKGKGKISLFLSKVFPGNILFRIYNFKMIKKNVIILNKSSIKNIPVRSKIV